jgi:hypothetical protein
MTYKEFTKLVDQTSNNFNWRYGQSLMNVLHGVWPEKYREITLSGSDPYHNDDFVSTTLDMLESNWKPTNENTN